MTLTLTLTLALTLRITKIHIISLVFIRFVWTKHQNISTRKECFIHHLDFDLDLGFDLENHINTHILETIHHKGSCSSSFCRVLSQEFDSRKKMSKKSCARRPDLVLVTRSKSSYSYSYHSSCMTFFSAMVRRRDMVLVPFDREFSGDVRNVKKFRDFAAVS